MSDKQTQPQPQPIIWIREDIANEAKADALKAEKLDKQENNHE